MDELARAPTGLVARARAWVERALGVGLPTYSSSGGGLPATPVYPVDMAMASMSANPWVWACVQAIVTDLCGLPLVAEQGVGLERTQTYTHWLLDLLERPSPKCSGRRFRRQLIADLSLTGNAYIRVWRGKDDRPVMLGRIVPSLIEANVGADGEIIDWTLTASGDRLPWGSVLHIGDFSWSQDRALVYGATRLSPLALGLSVDRDSRRQAGRAARRGRLEMMLTPDDPNVVISGESVRRIVDQYVTATETGDGVYVVNKAMKATPLTLTAREGEFLGISDRLRAEVLAVFSVPPVRAGEPAANYGTAKQQMRTYWETLQGLAALVDDELTRLAESGVRIRHSFANVEALQTSQTERQARALIWLQGFGMSPPDAASYEGFVDAPVPAEAPKAAAPVAPPPSDPKVDEPREAKAAVLSVLHTIGGLYASGEADPEAVEITTRTLLRTVLRTHRAETVDLVADEAAAVCRGAAELALEQGDVAAIRAFGSDHAARIVQLARCT